MSAACIQLLWLLKNASRSVLLDNTVRFDIAVLAACLMLSHLGVVSRVPYEQVPKALEAADLWEAGGSRHLTWRRCRIISLTRNRFEFDPTGFRDGWRRFCGRAWRHNADRAVSIGGHGASGVAMKMNTMALVVYKGTPPDAEKPCDHCESARSDINDHT